MIFPSKPVFSADGFIIITTERTRGVITSLWIDGQPIKINKDCVENNLDIIYDLIEITKRDINEFVIFALPFMTKPKKVYTYICLIDSGREVAKSLPKKTLLDWALMSWDELNIIEESDTLEDAQLDPVFMESIRASQLIDSKTGEVSKDLLNEFNSICQFFSFTKMPVISMLEFVRHPF